MREAESGKCAVRRGGVPAGHPANAVAFFAAEEGIYVTAMVIYVDGGAGWDERPRGRTRAK